MSSRGSGARELCSQGAERTDLEGVSLGSSLVMEFESQFFWQHGDFLVQGGERHFECHSQ